MTFIRKTDIGQNEIVQALRHLGMHVTSLHKAGNGVPDVLISYRGLWHVPEIKTGNSFLLTDSQVRFGQLALAPIPVLTTVDEAIEWANSLR